MKIFSFFPSLLGLLKKGSKKKPISLPDLEIVFILSAGRTGTHFLHHFFNTCFTQVYAVHEPYPDLFDLGMEKIRKNKPKDKLMDGIRHHRFPLLKKAQQENHTTFIESNPHAIYLIPEIKALFPRVRLLHLIRDPKAAVGSLYHKAPIKDGDGMLFYGNNDHRNRISPADFPGDKHAKDWESFNRLQKIAWYWNKANSIIIKDLIGIGDGMTLRYEDLFSSDLQRKKETLEMMIDFLGLEEKIKPDWPMIEKTLGQKTNATKTELLPPFEKWPEKEQAMLLDLTEEMRGKLGYG